MVFAAARDVVHKSLLDGSVQVPIAYHEVLPPLLKDGGVHLTQAGDEGNGPEVGG